jgi:hypothetical protein
VSRKETRKIRAWHVIALAAAVLIFVGYVFFLFTWFHFDDVILTPPNNYTYDSEIYSFAGHGSAETSFPLRTVEYVKQVEWDGNNLIIIGITTKTCGDSVKGSYAMEDGVIKLRFNRPSSDRSFPGDFCLPSSTGVIFTIKDIPVREYDLHFMDRRRGEYVRDRLRIDANGNIERESCASRENPDERIVCYEREWSIIPDGCNEEAPDRRPYCLAQIRCEGLPQVGDRYLQDNCYSDYQSLCYEIDDYDVCEATFGGCLKKQNLNLYSCVGYWEENAPEVEQELFRETIKSGDITQCENFNDVHLKQSCKESFWFDMAVDNLDGDICSNIDESLGDWMCGRDTRGTKTDCVETEQQEACVNKVIAARALTAGDHKICNDIETNIASQWPIAECMKEVIVEREDPSLCEDSPLREECYKFYAGRHNDPDVCKMICWRCEERSTCLDWHSDDI